MLGELLPQSGHAFKKPGLLILKSAQHKFVFEVACNLECIDEAVALVHVGDGEHGKEQVKVWRKLGRWRRGDFFERILQHLAT